ncbi:hypothetical protein [Enterobacter quasiroggenkampii]|uniref:hypothetical protein n=1 Tax=Enterobacter quasiroggenkampii TaxID=2497436 RepID=UPI0021CF8624|nr:hypothetical protein [Enterobacter quasiroggenkampii]MCU6359060.1 hypothetical protein [Enterobacter quasiroggenkampii]
MRIRLLSGMKHVGLITAGILSVAFIWLAINNWSQWKILHSPTMTCDAIINIHKARQLLSLRLRYSFLGDEGTATLSGVLNDGDKVSARISRHVFFTYKRVDDGVFLENTKTTISLQDTAGTEGLKDLLPEFYTVPGARTSFQVFAQKPGGYIFVKDFTPAFYCAEQ